LVGTCSLRGRDQRAARVGSLGGCGMHALAPDSRIAGRVVAIGVASPGGAPAHRAMICAPTRRKTPAALDTNKA
jgi:hypothetical protein